MMDIFWRSWWRPIFDVWTPSIKMFPSGSTRRNRAETRELFPAPVRPTTPTWFTEKPNYQHLQSSHTAAFAKVPHLLTRLQRETDVFEDQRSIRAVGHAHMVESHLTFVGPIRRRFLLGIPGCFTLHLCILHHPLHWGHLNRHIYH